MQRLSPGGFVLARVVATGICSTDLTRQFQPFPLPQIIGHEAVVIAEHPDQLCCVGINASHAALGLSEASAQCPMCRLGIPSQCPDRMTFGIDRLSGGFAPWCLVPSAEVVPLPAKISAATGTLLEPFAAALNAVSATTPRRGERVAVLGPRRLGSLVILALGLWKRAHPDEPFEVSALARRPEELRALLGAAGCYDVVDSRSVAPRSFDVVFDCSGSDAGLETALNASRRAVHIKSTPGHGGCGVAQLTALVVEEISLVGAQSTAPSKVVEMIHALWSCHPQTAPVHVLVSSSTVPQAVVSKWACLPGVVLHRFGSIAEARARMAECCSNKAAFGRFDVAVVSGAEIDDVLRDPATNSPPSLVRPRGIICIDSAPSQVLAEALERGVSVETSRCGNMKETVQLLAAHPENAAALERLASQMVTLQLPLSRMQEAFDAAKRSEHVKVIVFP